MSKQDIPLTKKVIAKQEKGVNIACHGCKFKGDIYVTEPSNSFGGLNQARIRVVCKGVIGSNKRPSLVKLPKPNVTEFTQCKRYFLAEENARKRRFQLRQSRKKDYVL